MPCAPSIAACAFDPATSCRQRRLSNGIEAFISRITAAGPSAKRPPHIALDACSMASSLSLRSGIVPLLLLGAVAGCDKHNAAAPQATPSKLPVEGTGTAAEAPPAKGDKV